MSRARARVPALFLAPWVDHGGTDKCTIDWFRWMDRDRYALSLLTTQPSANRRLSEVAPYTEETWALPDLLSGDAAARFVPGFIVDRGVRLVHIMNSRLGFELLPDIHALADRPRIVVQLHVEEPERDGYVRYACTRFGNLVDAFSVSTPGLADVLVEYGVTRDRIHVIMTGVDAEEEFSPERVAARTGLDPDVTKILFPARLVAQKDPLLLVDVVDALRAREPGFVVHVVGDGELEPALRRAIAERGLERWLRLHPSSAELPSWYAACDVLLMTSVFEGVPLVVYEAMAMGLALVAPALEGIRELVTAASAVLVEPRDDVGRYADALAGLVAMPAMAAAMGQAGREHVRTRFAVTAMAGAHAALYDDLLGPVPAATRPTAPAPSAGEAPLRFSDRRSGGTPLVSVVVPCFNHGAWLLECLQSLRAQTYPSLEIIVVDDASTDPDTAAALDEVERRGDARVLRLQRNAGPSAARNRGIEVAAGAYVLPVDADNLLLPEAVAQLVAHLQGAGERVGFVYQSLQYFGNREDFFVAPDHNVRTLMDGNYIDSSALIDRDVFDAGLRFGEDVLDGHEDWDFFLSLAERGIAGEPVRARTLMARSHGFSRSDRIDHVVGDQARTMAARHPILFGEGREAIKARWSPALSLVAFASPGDDRAASRESQTCRDFELLTVTDRDGEDLEQALRRARGRWILVTRGSVADALATPALVEQMLRLFAGDRDLRAVAFADAGGHDLRPLGDGEADGKALHALAWAVPDDPCRLTAVNVEDGDALVSLARAFALAGERLQWRQLRAPSRAAGAMATGPHRLLLLDHEPDANERRERELRLATPPSLPSAPPLGRLRTGEPWRPVHTHLLCRHRVSGGEGRLLTTSTDPVAGYELERILGPVRTRSWPGTARLVIDPEGEIGARPRGEAGAQTDCGRTLGYVEERHFGGLDPLMRGRHAQTGQVVLACGPDDPLRAQMVAPVQALGFIERAPINPHEPARGASFVRLSGLVRAADFDARRHRYAVGRVPAGRCVWELGAVLGEPLAGTVPFALADERVALGGENAGPRQAALGAALRWALSPLSWRGFGQGGARRRAALRRLAAAPGLVLRPAPAPPPAGEPAGWLLAEAGPGRIALYLAIHPVTGDQLLTVHPVEARDTGYGEPRLLGHLLGRAPQTGNLNRPTTAIPWATRFGAAVRWNRDRLC